MNVENSYINEALAQHFPLFAAINITHNEYTLLNTPNAKLGVFPAKGAYDDLLGLIAENTHRQAAEEMALALSRMKLLLAYCVGRRVHQQRIQCQCGRHDGQWAGILVSLTDNLPGSEIRGILLIDTVDSHPGRAQSSATAPECSREKDAEAFIDAMMESIPTAFCEFLLEPGFPLLRANNRFFDINGYTKERLHSEFGGQLIHLAHPKYASYMRENLLEAFDVGEKECNFRFQILRGDGLSRWVKLHGRFRDTAAGKVCSCIFSDVSKDERAYAGTGRGLEQAAESVLHYDMKTRTITDQQGFHDQYGVPHSLDNVPECMIERGYIRGADALAFREMFSKIDAGAHQAFCELRFYAPKFAGRFAWVRVTINSMARQADEAAQALVFVEFIDEQKKAEQVISIFERYQKVMMSDAIACYDINLSTNTILDASSIWEKKLLEIRKQLKRTDSYTELVHACAQELVSEDTRDIYMLSLDNGALMERFEKGITESRFEYARLGERDKYMWVSASIHMVRDDDGDIRMLLLYRDVSEEKEGIDNLVYQAQRDALTGLYNRNAGLELVEQQLASSGKGMNAFFILDVDNFKDINDSYGHHYGDVLLRDIARALCSTFRKNDVPIRLGGDEFIVFAFGFASLDQVEDKAKYILMCVKKLGHRCSPPVTCSVSIGIAVAPHEESHYEAMYKKADEALYEVKKTNKDAYKLVMIKEGMV